MAELTIGSIDVPVVSGGLASLTYIGNSSDSFNGTERNSVRASKRVWNFVSAYMDSTDRDALLAAIANGTAVSVSGDSIGSTVSCSVWCTGVQTVSGIDPKLYTVSLTVRERVAA